MTLHCVYLQNTPVKLRIKAGTYTELLNRVRHEVSKLGHNDVTLTPAVPSCDIIGISVHLLSLKDEATKRNIHIAPTAGECVFV